MKWINVNDRLPDKGVLVKVILRVGSISAKNIERTAFLMDNGRFNVNMDWSYVTHWMPISEPPDTNNPH